MDNQQSVKSKNKTFLVGCVVAILLLLLLICISLFIRAKTANWMYTTNVTVSCEQLKYENVTAKATIFTFMVEEPVSCRAWLLHELTIGDKTYSPYIFVDPAWNDNWNVDEDDSGNVWRIDFNFSKAGYFSVPNY